MSYFMGIDIGTSAVKVITIDNEGVVKGNTKRSYKIEIARDGFAAQHPETWWQAVAETIREMLTKYVIVKSEAIYG